MIWTWRARIWSQFRCYQLTEALLTCEPACYPRSICSRHLRVYLRWESGLEILFLFPFPKPQCPSQIPSQLTLSFMISYQISCQCQHIWQPLLSQLLTSNVVCFRVFPGQRWPSKHWCSSDSAEVLDRRILYSACSSTKLSPSLLRLGKELYGDISKGTETFEESGVYLAKY